MFSLGHGLTECQEPPGVTVDQMGHILVRL